MRTASFGGNKLTWKLLLKTGIETGIRWSTGGKYIVEQVSTPADVPECPAPPFPLFSFKTTPPHSRAFGVFTKVPKKSSPNQNARNIQPPRQKRNASQRTPKSLRPTPAVSLSRQAHSRQTSFITSSSSQSRLRTRGSGARAMKFPHASDRRNLRTQCSASVKGRDIAREASQRRLLHHLFPAIANDVVVRISTGSDAEILSQSQHQSSLPRACSCLSGGAKTIHLSGGLKSHWTPSNTSSSMSTKNLNQARHSILSPHTKLYRRLSSWE